MLSRSHTRRSTLALLVVALAACERGADPVSPRALSPAAAPALATGAASVEVVAGESIQAAVNAAAPGATIRVRGGVYREAVTVTVPNLRIVGLPGPGGAPVVIENPGTAANGIAVRNADGFQLSDVTVRGFRRNGVLLLDSDDFRLTRIVAEDNGAYGLYPIRSSNGVIEHCTATGSADAGIYVGLSNGVRVLRNTVFANVAGIEVSNANDVEVSHNVIRDNSIGILVTLVPGRPILTSTGVSITRNRVENNNLPNFAPPTDLVGAVPPGIGILILGPDDVLVEHNVVTGHAFFGVGVIDESVLLLLGAATPEELAPIETASNGVRVRFNEVRQNGFAPPPELADFFPGVDLLWDGTGEGNCWERNRYGTSVPSPLPACR